MSKTSAVLAFPGQGSQRQGMLEAIPETESLDRLLDAAEALIGHDLRRLASEGTPSELADTRIAQPLLYLTDWAWGSALLEIGVRPVAVAGHSLGELAALAIADAYSVEAGLELVCRRSQLMAHAAEQTPGTMAACLGLDRDVVARVIQDVEDVWVANDNSTDQVVISGTHEGVTAATEALRTAGSRRIVPLDAAGPFHSPLMSSAAQEFSRTLDDTELNEATVPVIQNTRPDPTTDPVSIRDALVYQMLSPVRWTESMRAIASYAPVTLIETGPGSVLKGLARKVEGLQAISVEDTDLESLVEEVLR